MKQASLFRRIVLFLTLSLATSLLNAGPITDPYRANGYTAGRQWVIHAAAGANGDIILLWQDSGRGGYTFMQRYNSVGQPLQAEEWPLANALSAGIDGAGNFVTVRTAADGSDVGVFATIYDRSGNIRRPEFRVNDTTAAAQNAPVVAVNGRGDFVVSWVNYASGQAAIYAKRFGPDGTAVAAERLLSQSGTGNQYVMDVGIDGLGNAVVTWYSQIPQSNIIDVWAHRFSAAGAPLGTPFRVNTYTTDVQVGNQVAMDTRGNFVIVWESYGQDGNQNGIYGQRFDSAGNRVGGEFRVNSMTAGAQQLADVAITYDGGFVVVWEEDNRSNDPSSLLKVYVRQFNASGIALGTETIAETTPNTRAFGPKVAMDGAGNFTVSWKHSDVSTNDIDVYARRYRMDYAPTVTPLYNGQTVPNLVGATGSWQYFKITVPPGYTTLDISIAGAPPGDADLYVRQAALPTLSLYDIRPWLVGSNEAVRVSYPRAGDWYIGVQGYSSYSNVTLSATFY